MACFCRLTCLPDIQTDFGYYKSFLSYYISDYLYLPGIGSRQTTRWKKASNRKIFRHSKDFGASDQKTTVRVFDLDTCVRRVFHIDAQVIKLQSQIFKGQTRHKIASQDAHKSCMDIYPMLQLYCMFSYNTLLCYSCSYCCGELM